jgi:arsenate reductase
MVSAALESFATADVARAEAVIARDRTVDALYAEIFSRMLSEMSRDPRSLNRTTRMQAVAKYLERIADHATNVAEKVVYLVSGRDIRHIGRIASTESLAPSAVLFLCVHNTARSQMAEAFARALLPPGIRVFSAGSQPASAIHDRTRAVMAEVGIDVSQQYPKRISDVPLAEIDMVVTLCAEEVCLTLPGGIRRETWVFPDPVSLASDSSAETQAFREVRDAIRRRVAEFAARFAPAS